MKNLKLAHIILFCFFFSLTKGQAATLFKRFEKPLLSLQKKLEAGDASSLLTGTARVEAFKLQALGRLMETQENIFAEVKKDFKNLEDAIGQAQKWNDLLTSGLPGNRNTYLKNFEKEKKNLQDLMEKWNKKEKISRYLLKIKEQDLNAKEADPFLISRVREELKDILKKEYDFSQGETGMHEFRRNLRWPAMEMDALQDLFALKSQTLCPFSELKELVLLAKDSKYAVLKTGQSNVNLTPCLYHGLLGAVQKLGMLKDELEARDVLDGQMPQEYQDKAILIYEQLIESGALKNLVIEIKSTNS